jgi:hypothetical protein
VHPARRFGDGALGSSLRLNGRQLGHLIDHDQDVGKRWRDLDLDRGVASVRQQWSRQGPFLTTDHRQRFFQHLRIAAERSLALRLRLDHATILLRWQVYYLSACSTSPETQS